MGLELGWNMKSRVVARLGSPTVAGYGIGRPDETLWISIAAHLNNSRYAALHDSLTIGIKISGQALAYLTPPSPSGEGDRAVVKFSLKVQIGKA
jgi:hypothetical protein